MFPKIEYSKDNKYIEELVLPLESASFRQMSV